MAQAKQPEIYRDNSSAFRAKRTVAARQNVSNIVIQWMWAAALFLLTNPFTFFLIGANPTAQTARNVATNRREDGSQMLLYGLRFAVMMFAILMAIRHFRTIGQMLPRLLPLTFYVLWAALSVSWSDSPASTINGIVSLLPLLVTAFCLAVSLPPSTAARIMLYSGMIMAAATLVFVALLPTYGVHQHADAQQAVHAGAWRGVYLHKNHLGQAAALYATGIAMAGQSILRSTVVKWLMFALMVWIVIQSDSASAAAIIPMAVLLVFVVVRLQALYKAFAYFVMVGATLSASLIVPLLFELLGRDMTLTGRTTIWGIAFGEIAKSPIWGFGYMSPTYGQFTFKVSIASSVLDPHNAYVDVLLGLGVVGLLFYFIALRAGIASAQRLVRMGGTNGEAGMVFSGILAAWLLASMTESDIRPLGVVGVLGLTSLTWLISSARERTLVLRASDGHADDNPDIEGVDETGPDPDQRKRASIW